MNQIHSRITCIALALISLAMSNSAQAVNYYVDSVAGNNGNNGTSASTPFQTLAHINSFAFKPGDTVGLKAGSSFTGGLVITASGNATSPITFTRYGTGSAPVISNDLTYGSYSDAVNLNSASYIIIDSLMLTGASQSGVCLDVNSNHNIMRNCEVTNAGEGAKVAGQYNLFTKNYIHDLIMVTNDTKSDNDYGATAFVISNSNNELSYNYILRCRAPSYDYGHDGGGFELYGNTSNISIHHNWVQDTDGFLESGDGLAKNITLAYNVSLNNFGFLDMHTSGGFAGSISNVAVENNTLLELTTSSDFSNLVYLDSPPSSTQFIFRNNIVVLKNDYYNPVNYTGADAVFKVDVPRNNNLYQFLSPGEAIHILNNWDNTLHAAETIGNPKLVNMAAANFQLSPGSPALGAGVPLGFATDYVGAAVSSTAPSLGAYESRPPAPPATLTATGGNSLIALNWYAASGATSYSVCRSSVSGGGYSVIATTATTSYNDTGLGNGVTYYYVVTASNSSGSSANSAQAGATTNTAITNWRLANFGTDSNSGSAADTADPDGDGRNNKLEYATGGNPNLAEAGSAAALGKTADGAKLTLIFNRISDPSLVYEVMASDDLSQGSWQVVWNSTGAQNVAGQVEAPDSELIANHSRRFLKLQISP